MNTPQSREICVFFVDGSTVVIRGNRFVFYNEIGSIDAYSLVIQVTGEDGNPVEVARFPRERVKGAAFEDAILEL